MSIFLTVKEASELSGKSPTTIYRLCNKRRNSAYIRKEDNKFLIDKDFLLATYPPDEKLISHEIEHGTIEITEPVFLEIEPKNKEKSTISVLPVDLLKENIKSPESEPTNILEEATKTEENPEEEEIVETEINPQDEEINNQEDNKTNQEFSPFAKIQDTASIISREIKQEQITKIKNISFYQNPEFWETFTGLSILFVALISLLLLLYFSAN